MTAFFALAGVLSLAVVAWLLRPLLQSPQPQPDTSAALNTALHRDQLSTLQTDRDSGRLSQADFEVARDELALRLLEDTQSRPTTAPNDPDKSSEATATAPARARTSAWLTGLGVPLLAAGLYLALGHPQALQPPPAPMGEAQIAEMVQKLEQRLKDKPDDAQGWAMLARSYKFMGRNDQARQAYEKTGPALQENIDWLLDYAELLATQANNQFAGRPATLVAQALQREPQHPLALMLSGVVAFQANDFKAAVGHWETVLTQMQPGSDEARQMQTNIDLARQRAGLPPSAQRAATSGSDSGKLPPPPAGAAAGMTPELINQMVERLANRLKDNPSDYAGWARLANAYKVQGKLDLADQAFQKTGPLLESDVNLITRYADFLASRSGSLQGKPRALVEKALKLQPDHPMALMMAAQAAYQAQQWAQAIAHWEHALKVLPADDPDAQQIRQEISDARARATGRAQP